MGRKLQDAVVGTANGGSAVSVRHSWALAPTLLCAELEGKLACSAKCQSCDSCGEVKNSDNIFQVVCFYILLGYSLVQGHYMMYMVFGHDFCLLPSTLLGCFYAVLSGLCWGAEPDGPQAAGRICGPG